MKAVARAFVYHGYAAGSVLRSAMPLLSTVMLSLRSIPVCAQEPQLIPQPRELEMTNQAFIVTPALQILIAPSRAAEDHGAAELLQDELAQVTGRTFPITSSPPESGVPV